MIDLFISRDLLCIDGHSSRNTHVDVCVEGRTGSAYVYVKKTNCQNDKDYDDIDNVQYADGDDCYFYFLFYSYICFCASAYLLYAQRVLAVAGLVVACGYVKKADCRHDDKDDDDSDNVRSDVGDDYFFLFMLLVIYLFIYLFVCIFLVHQLTFCTQHAC